MSEAPPPPEPPASGGPTDPAAPPSPAPWAPLDPLAAPQPWTPPTAWSPAPWSPPGTPAGIDTPGAPEIPAPTESPGPADAYPPADAYRPAYPPTYPPSGAAPPPGHPWPGQPAPAWPPPGYPPPYAYPGAPPARTNGGRTVAIVVGAVGVLLVLLFCGCVGVGLLGSLTGEPVASGEPYDVPGYDEPGYGEPGYGEPDEYGTGNEGLITAEPSRTPASTPSGGPGRHTVVYEVTGTTPADLEYYDANGDFIQTEQVKLPWRLKFTVQETDRLMLLTRHSTYPDDSLISCRIIVDGKVVVEETDETGTDC